MGVAGAYTLSEHSLIGMLSGTGTMAQVPLELLGGWVVSEWVARYQLKELSQG